MKKDKMNYPTISFIIPAYNEGDRVDRCLGSIREQDYPQDNIEIVFVDDDSKDDTVKKAKKYNIKLVRNGAHDYDIGKSLGIQNAKNEYILFLDADCFLTRKNWLKKLITPLLKNKEIIGAQPIWFKYNKNDKLFNKYCTLFGITDPLTIYLKKRDRLMLWEKKFRIGKVKEFPTYFLAEFNQKNLPTIGTVGFIIKKSYLLKTDYKPAFSHLDCMQDLIKQNYNKFAMVKLDVIHLHSSSLKAFLDKLKRNFNIFIRDYKKRRYTWQASFWKKIYAVFVMSSFILPLYHSIRGYMKIKDKVWFIHPFICLVVIMMYLRIFVSWKLAKTKPS